MMGITVEGDPLRINDREYFVTVFPPEDSEDLPQDFDSIEDARAYGNERYGEGRYEIESPCW